MKATILEPGKFYHIYNRAKNGKPLFPEEEDIQFFLKLYNTCRACGRDLGVLYS